MSDLQMLDLNLAVQKWTEPVYYPTPVTEKEPHFVVLTCDNRHETHMHGKVTEREAVEFCKSFDL